jgi:hypothetical protein
MKKVALLLFLINLFESSFSQTSNIQLQVRLPLQFDMQKAEIILPLSTKIQKANTINFGLDALTKLKIKKVSIFTGLGYFRNRFNIKRGYNHQALNPGIDSLPIGTDTENYNYSLFRLPLGLSFQVVETKKMKINIGAEFINNFSFKRKYNGRMPFEGANNVYNKFNYFGNSVHLFTGISTRNIEFQPYVRIYNNYKKDKILKENENETITRYFDAFGISILYSFKL